MCFVPPSVVVLAAALDFAALDFAALALLVVLAALVADFVEVVLLPLPPQAVSADTTITVLRSAAISFLVFICFPPLLY